MDDPGGWSFHRVDQVVGDLDVLQCLLEAFASQDVAAYYLDRARRIGSGIDGCCGSQRRACLCLQSEGAGGASGLAREGTYVVPFGDQLGSERRADETAGSRHEDVHAHTMMTGCLRRVRPVAIGGAGSGRAGVPGKCELGWERSQESDVVL